MRAIFFRFTVGGLLVLVVMVAQGRAQTDLPDGRFRAVTRVAGGRGSACPCAGVPFFASFLDAQRQLLACTNDTPLDNFVRLVAASIDLVVLFEFPSQLYCGWQQDGSPTSYMAVTAAEFDACKLLILRAAAQQGIPCLRER